MLVFIAYSLLLRVSFRSTSDLTVVGAFCLAIFAVIALEIARGRKALDFAQAEVLREFFEQLSYQVFKDDHLRITLFRPLPFSSKYIVPWYRYSTTDEDIITVADRSTARFEKGQGFTGKAWENIGELTCTTFDDFGGDREKFTKYYVEILGIPREVVDKISDYMVFTRTILSCGFEGTNNRFLGVLSIDLDKPIEFNANDKDSFPQIGTEPIFADELMYLINAISSVLDAFARTDYY